MSKEYRDSIPTVTAHSTLKCSLKKSDVDAVLKNVIRPCAGKFDKSCKEREITDEDARDLVESYKRRDTEEIPIDQIDFDEELRKIGEILASTDGDDHKMNNMKPVFRPAASTSKREQDFPSPVFSTQNVSGDQPLKKILALDPQPSMQAPKPGTSLIDKINSSFRKNSTALPVYNIPPPKTNSQTANRFQQNEQKPLLESSPDTVMIELPRNPCPDFSSAKQVLKVQNLKKFGNGNGQFKSHTGSTNANIQKQGRSIGLTRPSNSLTKTNDKPQAMEVDDAEDPLLKGIEPHILDIIKREVVVNIKDVKWEQIAGLENAKQIIQEAIMLPLTNPQLFVGLRTIPRGILLFGPPGSWTLLWLNFDFIILLSFYSIRNWQDINRTMHRFSSTSNIFQHLSLFTGVEVDRRRREAGPCSLPVRSC